MSRSNGTSRADGHSRSDRRIMKTSESVALAIVEDIVARGLGTGARLPTEAAMLARYEVSRQSLREAQRLLEVQGLIRLKPGPGGGAVVGSADPENLARTSSLYFHLGGMTYAELLDTQCRLEPLCAELAALHGDREEMRADFAPYMALPGDDAGDYSAEASGFHTVIYVHAGNRILTLITQSVTYMVTSHVIDTLLTTRPHADVVEEHRSIAEAILAGDAPEARRLVSEHFSALRDWVHAGWSEKLDAPVEWR